MRVRHKHSLLCNFYLSAGFALVLLWGCKGGGHAPDLDDLPISRFEKPPIMDSLPSQVDTPDSIPWESILNDTLRVVRWRLVPEIATADTPWSQWTDTVPSFPTSLPPRYDGKPHVIEISTKWSLDTVASAPQQIEWQTSIPVNVPSLHVLPIPLQYADSNPDGQFQYSLWAQGLQGRTYSSSCGAILKRSESSNADSSISIGNLHRFWFYNDSEFADSSVFIQDETYVSQYDASSLSYYQGTFAGTSKKDMVSGTTRSHGFLTTARIDIPTSSLLIGLHCQFIDTNFSESSTDTIWLAIPYRSKQK